MHPFKNHDFRQRSWEVVKLAENIIDEEFTILFIVSLYADGKIFKHQQLENYKLLKSGSMALVASA